MTKIQLSLAASLALALAGPVRAADTTSTSTQDREQLRAQVHHTVTTQGDVSEQDAKDVDAEVSSHAAHPGYGPDIKKAIHDALAETPPCKGTCLADRIHAINHAMDQGKTPDEAVKQAKKTAHATGGSSDAQARSQDHRRDMSRRDAAADRVHDRTMDRGQAGSHAMGAGHR
jgi:hypothetical protein